MSTFFEECTKFEKRSNIIKKSVICNQIQSDRLVDLLGVCTDLFAFLDGDAFQCFFLWKSPNIEPTRTDPFVVCGGAEQPQNCRKASTAGLWENDLHGIFDDRKNQLWIMRGDVGKGDAGVDDGKGDVRFVFEQLKERKHQIPLCISVNA